MKRTVLAIVLLASAAPVQAQPGVSLSAMPDEPPAVQGSAAQVVVRQDAIEARAPSDPGRPRAMLELAEAYRALDRRREETRTLARIVQDHPTYEVDLVLFRLAMALVAQGQHDRARQVWHRLVRTQPASPYVQAAYVAFADHYASSGDLAAARQFLERALSLPRGGWEAYARYRHAWLLAQAGDRPGAHAELDRAARAASQPGQVGASEVQAAIARDRAALSR